MRLREKKYFWLDLFKSKADAEDYNYHAWAAGYLTDNSDAATAVNQYSYTVTSSASTSIVQAEEGNDIVFTITRTNDTGGTDVASTVYVSTSDSLAYGGEDYKSLDLTQVDFKASETSKEITVKTYADNDTEGEEDFWLDLYKTKADAEDFNYHSYSTGYLKDAAGGGGSSATYSYAISITSGASTAEGGNITASVSRTVDSGSAGDSTIYFNTTAGSADETDYVAQKATAINFDSGNAAQTITIATLSDGDAGEGDETFWIDLFNTEADAEEGWDYFDYATATIADAAAIASAGITYSITNNSGYSSQQGEDQTVTFTISDGGSTAASTVYVSTVSGTASTGVDLEIEKNKLQVDFASDVDTVDVVVDLIHDTIDDDDEFFYLELYKTAQDADAGLSSTDSLAYINQVAPALDNWTYSVSNVGSYSNPISEGEDFVFTITRSGGTATNTTVYVSTTASSADESDYTAITGQAVTFTGSDDLSKTVTVSTTSDSVTEEMNIFGLIYLEQRADLAINNYDAWGTGYLQDPPAEGENSSVYFTVERSSSWNTTEGDDINFVVTKHGTATSTTTAYVATGFGTATQDTDYTNIPTTALEFGANETTKTVTVSTITDENDEPGSGYGETLFLLLINSSDGTYYNWISDTDGDGTNDSNGYDMAYIVDPVSSNSANAGNSSTPTVTITSAPKSSFPGHKAGTFFNDYAFALKTSSGSVVAWGNAAKGGVYKSCC